MIFYQAHWDDNQFGKLVTDPKDAFQELKNRGYEIVALRSVTNECTDYPLYDPNRKIGIAIVKI